MWLESVLEALNASGLNIAGVAPGENYRALLPGCQRVLVVGSGGPALWDAFVEDIRQHPEHLRDEQHPLDAFIARVVAAADPKPQKRRWIFCSPQEETFLDFRLLAAEANLGHKSRLGLLMHERFGPWLGLRAACLTTDPLPLSPPLSIASPCETCDAPCAKACPAAAFQPEWQVGLCASYAAQPEALCATGCLSRLACPVGKSEQYSKLERHYHYQRSTGRILLAKELGIDDALMGLDPRWQAWAIRG